MRNWAVLLLGLGQLLLGAERLVGLCGYMVSAGLRSCILSAGGTPYRHLDGLFRWSWEERDAGGCENSTNSMWQVRARSLALAENLAANPVTAVATARRPATALTES